MTSFSRNLIQPAQKQKTETEMFTADLVYRMIDLL